MSIDIGISIAVIGALAAIVSAYLTNLWGRHKETELRMQNLNEEKYRTVLVWMRCLLEPENADQFSFEGKNDLRHYTLEEIKERAVRQLKERYYNSTLYASDEVVVGIKRFLSNPTEENFFRVSSAMRKDLWKTKTKLDPQSLSLE